VNGAPHPANSLEPHLVALDGAQWSELESSIERFETAWARGIPPDIDDYLPQDSTAHAAILIELVATDLEWRCRGGLNTALEEYLARFPELTENSAALIHLATCEFRAGQDLGLRVDVE